MGDDWLILIVRLKHAIINFSVSTVSQIMSKGWNFLALGQGRDNSDARMQDLVCFLLSLYNTCIMNNQSLFGSYF